MAPELSHRVKFERACDHLLELDARIGRWRENGRSSVFFEPDPADTEYQFLKVFLEDIPLGLFSPIIGDIVQNLRAGLDHIIQLLSITNLSRALTKEETKQAKFPIFKSPSEFRDKGGSSIDLMCPKARAVIERLQPYNTITNGWFGGVSGHPLWQLHKMAVSDKHHSLAVTVAVIPCFRMTSRYEPDGPGKVGSFASDGWHSFGRFMESNVPIARVPRFPPDVKVDVQGSFEIALRNPPGPSAGDPIRETLGDMCLYIEREVFPPLEALL